MQWLSGLLRSVAEGKTALELKAQVMSDPGLTNVYPASIHEVDGSVFFLARTDRGKKLFVAGDGSRAFHELEGALARLENIDLKECELTVANSRVIRRFFPFTNPVPLRGCDTTIGLGDRLGVASPGHIRAVGTSHAKPVLAQQSIRELTLTGRTFDQVLADVVWAVFQEDYRDGFGADGDHLKSMDEVRLALDSGFTMITLDCSNYIRNLGPECREEIEGIYMQFDGAKRRSLEQRFLSGPFILESGFTVTFTPETLKRNVAVYQQAIEFAIRVYDELIRPVSDRVDFEMSIDETATPTDPASHFFVAAQLAEAGVRVDSLAPRFCGEFQKGIDYLGDLRQFEREFRSHVEIAEHFGYRLSIHSGSDKFSVFPIIGRETKGRVHVKTAGTNWLEAVRVIIETDPDLYRELHEFAFEHLEEARRYYHVTLNRDRIPDVRELTDAELRDLMNQNDTRQMVHIAYGTILQAKDQAGGYVFRDRIYRCLYENEEMYYRFLQGHIGRHLETLGLSRQ